MPKDMYVNIATIIYSAPFLNDENLDKLVHQFKDKCDRAFYKESKTNTELVHHIVKENLAV